MERNTVHFVSNHDYDKFGTHLRGREPVPLYRFSQPGPSSAGQSLAGESYRGINPREWPKFDTWQKNDVAFEANGSISTAEDDTDHATEHFRYLDTQLSISQGHAEQPEGRLNPGTRLTIEDQLDRNYAYCYDRGDGQYTRLIPADTLPPLNNIPAVQQNCSGMIVLPQPRATPPGGLSRNMEPIILSGKIHPENPLKQPEIIQITIDGIVASTPSSPRITPQNPPGKPSAASSSRRSSCQELNPQAPLPRASLRRPKIYCDKWVHEGVCAFTQQGCRYKHEMPLDKSTQHQLGLFHGLPAWWKKQQSDLQRQCELIHGVVRDIRGCYNTGDAENVVGPGRGHGWHERPLEAEVAEPAGTGAGGPPCGPLWKQPPRFEWRQRPDGGARGDLGPLASGDKSPYGPIQPPHRLEAFSASGGGTLCQRLHTKTKMMDSGYDT